MCAHVWYHWIASVFWAFTLNGWISLIFHGCRGVHKLNKLFNRKLGHSPGHLFSWVFRLSQVILRMLFPSRWHIPMSWVAMVSQYDLMAEEILSRCLVARDMTSMITVSLTVRSMFPFQSQLFFGFSYYYVGIKTARIFRRQWYRHLKSFLIPRL